MGSMIKQRSIDMLQSDDWALPVTSAHRRRLVHPDIERTGFKYAWLFRLQGRGTCLRRSPQCCGAASTCSTNRKRPPGRSTRAASRSVAFTSGTEHSTCREQELDSVGFESSELSTRYHLACTSVTKHSHCKNSNGVGSQVYRVQHRRRLAQRRVHIWPRAQHRKRALSLHKDSK